MRETRRSENNVGNEDHCLGCGSTLRSGPAPSRRVLLQRVEISDNKYMWLKPTPSKSESEEMNAVDYWSCRKQLAVATIFDDVTEVVFTRMASPTLDVSPRHLSFQQMWMCRTQTISHTCSTVSVHRKLQHPSKHGSHTEQWEIRCLQ